MEMPTSGNFTAVPLPLPATTSARCFGVIDIGTVPDTYKNVTKMKRKVMILFELPKYLATFSEEKGEQPFMIMIEHNLSGHPDSNFAKFIASWRNKPLTADEQKNFPIEKMLGKIALISFRQKIRVKFRGQDLGQVTNEHGYLEIGSIGQVPEEMKPVPEMMNEKILWLWEDITKKGETFDKEKFGKVFKFLREKIYTSEEFKACPSAINIDVEDNQAQAPADQPAASSQEQPAQQEDSVGDDWD